VPMRLLIADLWYLVVAQVKTRKGKKGERKLAFPSGRNREVEQNQRKRVENGQFK